MMLLTKSKAKIAIALVTAICLLFAGLLLIAFAPITDGLTGDVKNFLVVSGMGMVCLSLLLTILASKL